MIHHLGSVFSTESAFIDRDAAVAHSGDIAESAFGLVTGSVAGEPPRLEVSPAHLEMKRQLVVDVGAHIRAPESQVSPPARPRVGDAHNALP